MQVQNVLLIPNFRFQLISIRVLDTLGFKTQFGCNCMLIKKQGIIAATGSFSFSNLYAPDIQKNL